MNLDATIIRKKLIGDKAFSDNFRELRMPLLETLIDSERDRRQQQLSILASNTDSSASLRLREAGQENHSQQVEFNVPELKPINILESGNYFRSIQNWHGEIIELQSDSFLAKLVDTKDPSGTYETMKFEIKEIPESDLALMKLGATFYFSIGYEMRFGTIQRSSFLKFRRLPDWTVSEIDRVSDWVDKMKKDPNW